MSKLSFFIFCLLLTSVGSLDFIKDIIQKALNFVKPVVYHFQQTGGIQFQDDPVKTLSLETLYLCQNRPEICDFLLCSAENFKHSEDFANINFVAQVLADRPLRKSVISDPEVLKTICAEAKLTEGQCDFFKSGFKLVDRFVSVLEDVGGGRKRRRRSENYDYYDYYSNEEFDFGDIGPTKPPFIPKDCAALLEAARTPIFKT